MHSWRGLLISLFIAFPCFLSARAVPVLIQDPLSRDAETLESLDFQLHARYGDLLIGTLPRDDESILCEGVLILPEAIGDFTDVYQVDPRALARKSGLREQLDILFIYDGLLLIKAKPQHLNALSSAGITFRAIPNTARRIQTSKPSPPGLDTIDPFVGVILDQVSASAYENSIQSLQDFITRNTYNPECDSAALWILGQFQNMGLSTWLDSFQIGGLTRYSVIAELPGTHYPDQIYYIIAHHDATAGLPVLPEDEAPGADDDGSGSALVLECARVMSQFSFQNTVRFAVFAGNEQGLIGSEAYASGLPIPGEDYLGVFDADMIGWAGSDPWPPDLVIYTNDDPVSISLANKINEAVTQFVNGFIELVILQDASMVYADHAPFWDANIPAILAMEDEAWGPDLNPYYHSDDDLLENLDISYALHALEAVLASVADLAAPNGSTEPYLTADGVIIDDSQGNNNGQIEYGESVFMTIPVINAGGGDATSVDVVLSESDPYITLTDWQEAYGTIPSQDTVSITNAFSADVTLDVPDQHIFNITVTMTSGTDVWYSIVQMAAHAPNIVIDELVVDDSFGGNGNGILEPGESANFLTTLYNEGSYLAENLIATLSCANVNIVVNTPIQSYGTLNPYTGSTQNFNVSALPSAPSYFSADFTLSYEAAGDWTGMDEFSIDVGDITHMPTGPDEYGYSAYDVNDEPFAPTYDWIEIDPNSGGSGTELNFTEDDQTLYVDLPFTFVYYGQSYTELSICSNGWVACGHTNSTAYGNSGIPGENGPPAMIAPFWEDLSPQHDGTVCYYYDSAEGLFIVEYNDVRDFYPTWHHMTFEVILYDPAVYPTSTGDGKILFQYGELDNTSSCTVGIENQEQNDGLQYLYNGSYDQRATPIEEGMAILFTTGEDFPDVAVALTPYGAPIQIPASGGTFDFNIAVTNNELTTTSFDLWIDVTLPNGNPYGPVLGPVPLSMPGSMSANRDRTQSVPAGAPPGNYFYNAYVGSYPSTIYDTDTFSFSKLTISYELVFDEWENWGEALDFGEPPASAFNSTIPEKFSLGQNFPNPFNSETVIPFDLPERSQVRVELYNLNGQRVATISDGVLEAGKEQVSFNALDLSSGVYFYRIEASGLEDGGCFSGIGKMLLLK